MISFVALFLIFIHLGDTFAVEEVSVADPNNVRLLDVNWESRKNSLRDDLRRLLLYPEFGNFDLGQKKLNLDIPLKLSLTIDNKNEVQNNQQTISGLIDQCKYLVGRSQIPLCRLNPSDKSSKVNYPKNCREIQESGSNKSGVYLIKPRNANKPFNVLCDMEIKGGGWTHIQKRVDGSQDFYLPWRDYKFGFGDLLGEFWIGLENIYQLTAFDRNELLIELTETDRNISNAQYSTFSIGCEKDGYPLAELAGYSGNAGDGLKYHLGQKFSTLDVDQDSYPGNCAKIYEGAWWYNACHHSNLNGKYMTVVLPDAYLAHGLNWHQLKNGYVNLAGSRMMIRPIG